MKPVISTIKDIYPSSQAEAQKQRYKSAVTAFAEHFGSIGEHRFFSAPGRTEICGNHTDHNHPRTAWIFPSLRSCPRRRTPPLR